MKFEKIDRFIPIEDEPDDFFIVCTSFEARCLGAIDKAVEGKYRAKYVIIIDYEEREPQKDREWNKYRREMIKKSHLLTPLGRGGTKILSCSRDDFRSGYDELPNLLNCLGYPAASKDLNITIDISTMTKPYILLMLKALDSFERSNIRVVHTEPAEYSERDLSLGVKSIDWIPFFNGHPQSFNSTLLIIFPGFEGERSYAIWEELEPQKTFVFFSNPGYRYGYYEFAKKRNKQLLREPMVEEKTIHPRKPDEVVKALKGLCAENPDWNIVVAPLGTKLETVGVYLFTREYPEKGIQIVYARPLRYLEYSKGRCEISSAFLPKRYPVFSEDASLWQVIGSGEGDGKPVAYEHDKYLYGAG